MTLNRNYEGWVKDAVKSWSVRRDAAELRKRSWRLWLAGNKNRIKLSEAFHDATLNLPAGREPGEPERYIMRAHAQKSGMSIVLIVFLLSVAWQILWELWKRRHPAK